jgi:hypothetical protein
MEEFELIEDYLKGKLQGQALKDFETRLASDSSFGTKVEEHKIMQDLLFTQGLIETREKLQAIRKAKIAKEGGKGGKNRWMNGLGIIIISFVMVNSIYVVFFKEKLSEKSKDVTFVQNEEIKEIEKTNAGKQERNSNPTNYNNKMDRIKDRNMLPVPGPDTITLRDKSIQSSVIPDTHNLKRKELNTVVEKKTSPKVNPEAVSCAGVYIKAKIQTEESCLDKATGKLYVSQVAGGNSPYRFSIDNSEVSVQNSYFEHLTPGKHQIRITDAGGCMTSMEAELLSKPCQPDKSNIFAPDYGETWKFPINPEGNCKVRIYDATGNIVYEVNTFNGQPFEWNGVGNNESYIRAGAYLYQISCDDGVINEGSVTVTR